MPGLVDRKQWFSAFLSAALLTLAFPIAGLAGLAWVALVPWLALIPSLSRRQAFFVSWAIGAVFFLFSMEWLAWLARIVGPAAFLGWFALSAYLGLYFGAFGFFARLVLKDPNRGAGKDVALSAILAGAWVLLEAGRSVLFSGMGWNMLAYSQTPWPAVLQVAELTGAWGVSFLIVWVNALLYFGWRRLKDRKPHGLAPAGLALLLVGGAATWGYQRMRALPAATDSIRVVVVQGNIPQEKKWDESYQGFITARYAEVTRAAASAKPELIIWPETSVPGYLGMNEDLTQWAFGMSKESGAPMLVGTPMIALPSMGLVNRAALVFPSNELGETYDKMHLVPFGEFIPFERTMPWLRQVLPPTGTFEPGNRTTVFRLPDQPPFSVLICFEDLFPGIARAFAKAGARWLIVITNDAWFGPSAAYQHAQASTLRAVEFRMPVARAANTGWSGCIDAAGRWKEFVHDASGKALFVPGFAACAIEPTGLTTFYARHGEWFIGLCALLAAAGVGWAAKSRF